MELLARLCGPSIPVVYVSTVPREDNPIPLFSRLPSASALWKYHQISSNIIKYHQICSPVEHIQLHLDPEDICDELVWSYLCDVGIKCIGFHVQLRVEEYLQTRS